MAVEQQGFDGLRDAGDGGVALIDQLHHDRGNHVVAVRRLGRVDAARQGGQGNEGRVVIALKGTAAVRDQNANHGERLGIEPHRLPHGVAVGKEVGGQGVPEYDHARRPLDIVGCNERAAGDLGVAYGGVDLGNTVDRGLNRAFRRDERSVK